MSSPESSAEIASPTSAAKGQLKVAARKIINSQKADGNVIRELKQLYSTRLLPIEKQYLFSKLHYPEILDSELSAKPTVLLVGQYSTGKTSFIRNLLGMDYPEIHIGPEVLSDTASNKRSSNKPLFRCFTQFRILVKHAQRNFNFLHSPQPIDLLL